MKSFVLSLVAVLAVAGCSSDDDASGAPTDASNDTATAADTGTASDAGEDSAADSAPADTSTADSSTADSSTADASDAASDAATDTGPTVSSNPDAPTPLTVGTPVTTTLAADGEHFFEYTPSTSGDHTLHLTAPGSKWYANQSTAKGAHFCGLPQCVMGTGTATLTGLAAGTTYYLNVYNGDATSGSYTISVTNP